MSLDIPKFKNKKELYKFLRNESKELIQMKKAVKKEFCTSLTPFKKYKGSIQNKSSAQDTEDLINRSFVGNTYYWLDSHEDVHLKGCFTKTIKETKKIYHLSDHKFERTSQVGKIKSVVEEVTPWRDLGVDKDGETICLVANSDITKSYSSLIFDEYKHYEVDQHSVGMRYVSFKLAYGSEEEEDRENKELWDSLLPLLGNKEEAQELGFFWAVKEAKLSEISCVLLASNGLTPTIKNQEGCDADLYKKIEGSLSLHRNKDNLLEHWNLVRKALDEPLKQKNKPSILDTWDKMEQEESKTKNIIQQYKF